MLAYYILIIIPLVIYFLGCYKGKKWDNQCLFVFFSILLFLLAVRNVTCGVDTKMYSNFFNVLSDYSIKQIMDFSIKGEFLYFILNRLVAYLGGNFQFFLFITAIISIVPIAVLYLKKSNNAPLTIALFLTVAPFTMFFSGLRQATAMGIVVLLFPLIEKKKPIGYIIGIIIASYFHKSASVALILYPIYHAKITKNWLYIIVPAYLLIYIYNKQIFTYLLGFYNSIYEETYGYTSSTGQFSILVLLILFNIYCFIFPDNNKMDKEYIGLRNLLLLATLFQLFVPINPIVMRMNYYTLLFIPLLIPKVAPISHKNNIALLRLSEIIMVAFFMAYFIYQGYAGHDVLNIYPYIPFWR